MFKRVFVFILVLFYCVSIRANFFGWQVVESDYYRVYYKTGKQYQAKQVIDALESYQSTIAGLTNYTVPKTTVVLEDHGLQSNGFSLALQEKMVLNLQPPLSSDFIVQYKNWLRLVGIHEATHLAHITKSPSSWSKAVFGNISCPHLYAPGWLKEGIAIYSESLIVRDEGRLNDGYYDAIFQAFGQEIPSLGQITLYNTQFPLNDYYIFGAGFVDFLIKRYGEDAFSKFISLYADTGWGVLEPLRGRVLKMIPSLGLDLSAKKIYKKGLNDLYQDWKLFVQGSLKNKSVDHNVVTNTGWQKKYLKAHNGLLYFTDTPVYTPEAFQPSFKHFIRVLDPKTNQTKVIKRFISRVKAPLQFLNNDLFYAVEEIEPGYDNVSGLSYGYTRVLFQHDLRSNESTRLFKDPVLAFLVMPGQKKADFKVVYAKSLNESFGSSIWVWENGKKRYKGNIPLYVSEMAVYKNQAYLVAKARDESWNVYRLTFHPFKWEPVLISNSFKVDISIDQDQLYFTANDHDGYHLYRLNLSTEKIDQLTNSGYARYGAVCQNKLYSIGLTPDGNELVQMPLKVKSTRSLKKEKHRYRSGQELAHLNVSKPAVLSTNLSHLAAPFFLPSWPGVLGGEDGLNLLSYQVAFDSSLGIQYQVNSRHFAPMQLSYKNVLDKKSYLNMHWPLFRSVQEGFQSVSFLYQTDFNKDAMPGVKFSYKIPKHYFEAATYASLETNENLSNLAYQLTIDNQRFFVNLSQFSNHDMVLNFISTAELFDQASGSMLYMGWTHLLWNIDYFSWNPSCFISNIYGNLYYMHAGLDQYIASDDAAYTLQYKRLGYEFQYEVGVPDLPVILKTGVAIAEDMSTEPYINVFFNYSF